MRKNKQWLVSLWLIWYLFSRSALYHTEPAAPCLFPSCRRRWRSCICTKTKAGSQTEHSFPHMDKAQTQTHFLDKAVSDSCWTDTIYWPLILEASKGLICVSSMVVWCFSFDLCHSYFIGYQAQKHGFSYWGTPHFVLNWCLGFLVLNHLFFLIYANL